MLNPYLNHILGKINDFIDRANLRTILLTALTIIFTAYCIMRTIDVRIIQQHGYVTETYIPNDSLISITQDSSKIRIPNITIRRNSNKHITTHEIEFISALSPLAKKEAKKYSIPASIKIAQSALESSWGKSEIARKANNYYGIKKKKALSEAEKVLVADRIRHRTTEYENNRKIKKVEEFCSYDSRWASFRHHSVFLRKRIDSSYNKGYSKMKNLPLKAYKKWARALQESGYSTDPDYANKLIRIIEAYKLHQLDK